MALVHSNSLKRLTYNQDTGINPVKTLIELQGLVWDKKSLINRLVPRRKNSLRGTHFFNDFFCVHNPLCLNLNAEFETRDMPLSFYQ